MSQSIYRTYRPKSFAQVAGQNHVKVALQYQIQHGKVSHAYLFCGPRAVGKTTTARLLAKALNCQNRKEGEYEPCNTCDHCKSILENSAIDIIEIDAASHTGVDHVREHIIANARMVPSQMKYKVFIIDEVHMLSISAFNALLKILEEPPAHVVFILATTEIHKVPQTIISRCQRFDFQRIPTSDMVSRLQYIVKEEEIECDTDVLERIASHSEGCLRDAESLLGQVIALGHLEGKKQRITLELAELVIPKSYHDQVIALSLSLLHKDRMKGIDILKGLSDAGANMQEFAQEFITFLRNLLVYRVTSQVDELSSFASADQLKKIMDEFKEVSPALLISWIDTFIKRKEQIRLTPLPQLALELAVLEACGAGIPITEKKVTVQTETVQKEESKPVVKEPPVMKEQKEEIEYEEGEVKLEMIQDKWVEILAESEKVNHSLPFILKVSRPTQVNGNKVTVTFKYPLHHEKAQEQKTLSNMREVLSTVLKTKLEVIPTLDQELNVDDGLTQKVFSDEEVNDVIDVFGGKVVE